MNKTLISNAGTLLLGLTLVGGAFASLSLNGPQDGEEKKGDHSEEEHAEGEHNELHESMERMQKSMKGLRKLLRKPEDKAAAMDLVLSMEKGALEGFMHPPKPAEDLDASAALAYQADFKKRMLSLAGTLVDLELALDKGDADEVKTLYRALGASKKDGHDIYIK